MSFKKFKTENILLASIVVLSLFLFASAFSREVGTNVSLAEEESGASGSSENSQDSEKSEESEESEESEHCGQD